MNTNQGLYPSMCDRYRLTSQARGLSENVTFGIGVFGSGTSKIGGIEEVNLTEISVS